MEMRDGLPGVRTVIEDKPESGLRQTQLLCHLSRFEQEVSKDGLIFGFSLGDAGNGFPGNDQNMGGGLGPNVPKGHDQFVLIDNRPGDLTRNDFLKQRFAHNLS